MLYCACKKVELWNNILLIRKIVVVNFEICRYPWPKIKVLIKNSLSEPFM